MDLLFEMHPVLPDFSGIRAGALIYRTNADDGDQLYIVLMAEDHGKVFAKNYFSQTEVTLTLDPLHDRISNLEVQYRGVLLPTPNNHSEG